VTILLSYGNAEDLNTCFKWMKKLSRDLNVNMIAYDYPGYGESSGKSRRDCDTIEPLLDTPLSLLRSDTPFTRCSERRKLLYLH
jgi:hypothetical protein